MEVTPDAACPLGVPIEAPKSFAEMSERAAFCAPIDPHDHTLTDVLSEYSFDQMTPCGLSTCRTEHHYGFLVRTASGVETNIGNVCGKRYFGDDFVTAASVHRRQVARRDALKTLATMRQHQGAIEAEISRLVAGPFGIKWLRNLNKFLELRLGVTGLALLSRRARSQDYNVEEASELDEEQIEEAMTRTGRKRDDVRYHTAIVGTLSPMPWLIFDFKGVLMDGLQANLRTACSTDETVTDTRLLKKILQPLGGWEKALEQTREALTHAPAALAPTNLLLLLKAVKPAVPGKKAPQLSGWDQTREYKQLISGTATPLSSTPIIGPQKAKHHS